jgi:electron transport complex protein RnfG
MKESIRLVVALTVFCIVAGLLLAWTNAVTKTPIEKAKDEEKLVILRKILPDSDNNLLADARNVEDKGQKWTFYVGKRAGQTTGVAFSSISKRGYGGSIEVMASLNSEGHVLSVEIFAAPAETPGLGTKIKEAKFLDQFKNRPASDLRWAKVTKDAGAIQGVTGATISSRAVVEAVRNGLEVFVSHRREIIGTTSASAAANKE